MSLKWLLLFKTDKTKIMNSSANQTQITSQIKAGILTRLVGQIFPFRGSNKRIERLIKWWRDGITYPTDFDLSNIATNGSITISVEFDLWVSIDLDGNSKPTGTVNGYLDNIVIGFSTPDYYVDLSNAVITRLSIK